MWLLMAEASKFDDAGGNTEAVDCRVELVLQGGCKRETGVCFMTKVFF